MRVATNQWGLPGDLGGTILLVAGLILMAMFFGFMIFDAWRMRRRFRKFRSRHK